MKKSQRALQIWPILINAAANRQVLTYKSVGMLIGMPPIALAQPLGSIMRFCQRSNLPPLTILVVSEKSGLPGEGLTTISDLNQDREAVYAFNWYGLQPLREEDLVDSATPAGDLTITDALLAVGETLDPATLFPVLVPGADQFIQDHPYAFALATVLDRGTKADIIWTIPYDLYQKLGHLDPLIIHEMSLEELAEIVDSLPRKPRYRTDAPRTIKELTDLVVTDCEGDATLIWKGKSAAEVHRTFKSLFGVGEGIANMALLLIEKAYRIKFSDLDRKGMDIKPDVHTMRVLCRLGVAESESESAAVHAARHLSPDFPGAIDGPLWTIGREWCHAHHPDCAHCPLSQVCEKKV